MFIFASQVVYLILSEGEQSAFICQQIRKVFHSTLFNKGTRIDFKIYTSFDLDTEWTKRTERKKHCGAICKTKPPRVNLG